MNCGTLLLTQFQTDNLEARIWIISTIEWQQHSSVYVQEIIQSEGKLKARGLVRLFTSTKGVVSVKTCAHSVTLKRTNRAPHSSMHFHIVKWTNELLWQYPLCKNSVGGTVRKRSVKTPNADYCYFHMEILYVDICKFVTCSMNTL